jgi:hypothetical protein
MPSALVPVFISGCAHATQDRGDRGFDRQQPGRAALAGKQGMPKRASRREIAQCIAMIGGKTGQWCLGGLSAPPE